MQKSIKPRYGKRGNSIHLLARISRNYPDWPSVEAFVRRVSILDPILVILFGSLAKEDFTDASDADILVCFEQPRPWMDVYRCSNGIVQPLVFSAEKLHEELRKGNALLKEAIQTGHLLYGSKALWRSLRRDYD